MVSRSLCFVIAAACLLVAGCDSESPTVPPEAVTPPAANPAAANPPGAAAAAVPEIELDLPVEVIVRQRSTSDVADGAFRLTIDDVTRAQVMASLTDNEGTVLLAPTSLAVGDSATFQLGETLCKLTLDELSNALVGEDFATFTIAAASTETATVDSSSRGGRPLSEAEMIEWLIAHVRSMDGATFIRNGVEHDASEAADHLYSKWQLNIGMISTAEQFIDVIATKPSLSGEPYLIRRADGSTVPAGAYLHEQLAELKDAAKKAASE